MIIDVSSAIELMRSAAEKARIARAERRESRNRHRQIVVKKQKADASRNYRRELLFQRLLVAAIRSQEAFEIRNPTAEQLKFCNEMGLIAQVVFRRSKSYVVLSRQRQELVSKLEFLSTQLSEILNDKTYGKFEASPVFVQWTREYPKTYQRFRNGLEEFENLGHLLYHLSFGFGDHDFYSSVDNPQKLEGGKARNSQTTFDKLNEQELCEVYFKSVNVLYERLTGMPFDEKRYRELEKARQRIEPAIFKLQKKIEKILSNPNYVYGDAVDCVVTIRTYPTKEPFGEQESIFHSYCLSWAWSEKGVHFYKWLSKSVSNSISRLQPSCEVHISDKGEKSPKGLSSSYYRFSETGRYIEGPPFTLFKTLVDPLGFTVSIDGIADDYVVKLSGWT